MNCYRLYYKIPYYYRIPLEKDEWDIVTIEHGASALEAAQHHFRPGIEICCATQADYKVVHYDNPHDVSYFRIEVKTPPF